MPTQPPPLVLDTNVVLDWLVFADPRSASLARAIGAGQVRWLATAAMRLELERVLTREALARWQPDVAAVLARWDRRAEAVEPAPPTTSPGWRCTDPDDQIFIDLALHHRAGALLTRDRAVLRLAARARAFGIAIQPPERWQAPAA